MPESFSKLIAGHERHILARMIADDEMQEVSQDGFVGPYRLIECLGEGGFGFVWRAEQVEPVRREVALKVLKRGMDTAQVLSRFSLEQQALASMEHPHIAALLDAGATIDGRPYFVMELVRGSSVTAWCREKKLPLEKRVELFKQVCAGVLHAHQKGIIHRDLKPTNILVAEVDGMPTPKIIDFGIAKAMTAGFTGHTMDTRPGHVVGTPLYMSPEQLAGERDADVRSDVYALGVLFYEMLTGMLPYQAYARPETSPVEMLRIVSQRRPQRPSVAITDTIKMTPVQQRQEADAARLLGGIPADLDWIILKALEHDRERRYDSVASLMADVEHFLRLEPVLARPPSFSYLAGRWVRRHRLAAAAATISVTAVLGGAALALWQAHLARMAQAVAEKESFRAQQAAGFLTTMLDRVAEEVAKGRNPEALKLALEDSRHQIESLSQDPALQAELFNRVGWLYETMGERKLALPLLEAHARALARLHGDNSDEVWKAELNHLARFIDHGARSSAPPMLADLRARVEKAGKKMSEVWFLVRRQEVRVQAKLRRPDLAIPIAREVLADLSKANVSNWTAIVVKISCSDAFQEGNQFDLAERLIRECIAAAASFKDSDMLKARLHESLVSILRRKKDFAAAVNTMRERIDELRKRFGQDSLTLVLPLLELAEVQEEGRSLEGAAESARVAVRAARKEAAQQPDKVSMDGLSPREALVRSLKELAGYESRRGRHQEALKLASEACVIAEEQGHLTRQADALLALAQVQEQAGDLEAAYRTYQQRRSRTGSGGANYQRWHEDLRSMVEIRLRQKRPLEALRLVRELWQLENASEEARADQEFMASIARLALRCHEAAEAAGLMTENPAELAAWRQSIQEHSR